MFSEPIQFYFVKQGASATLETDLERIIQQLGTYNEEGFGLKRTMESVIITFDNSATKAILQISPKPKFSDAEISNQMILTCEKDDHISVNVLRNIIRGMGYRVFNPSLGCFNTTDPDLIDLTSLDISPKIKMILKNQGFNPLFNYRNNLVFFAQKSNSKAIYLINSNLLLHLVEKGDLLDFDKKEFSLKVADDIGHFIALYDKGLIQGTFYEPRRPFMNQSGFDIAKLEKDIFIRPLFFKYNDERQSFEQFNGHMTRRDLIKKGSNLKNYPQSTLDDLKIKNKFLTAKVMRGIEYEGHQKCLIPRLNLSIYIDQ